jgi:putative MATE family efflux protein
MKYLVRENQFYKTFYSLTALIALQALITFSVNLADNLMLGAYNEYALSGAALVNQVQFLLQMLVTGIATGSVILGAQYWGKGEQEPIQHIVCLGLKFAILIGAAFSLVTLLLPRQVLLLLSSDETVVAEGVKYLRIMWVTYVVFAISNTLIMSLRAVESTVIGPITSLTTLVLNVCLNYIFIFGHFGAPELGIYGAAIATLTSRVVELVIVVVYLLVVDKRLQLRPTMLLESDKEYRRDYIRVTTPVFITSGLWGVAQAVQTAILGHMSATAIAANSIASVISQITSVTVSASSNSSSILIGKTIGEGRTDCIKPYAITMQLLFILNGVVSALLLWALKDAFVSLYAVSEETKAMAREFILVMILVMVPMAYQLPVGCGIIQGGGDTKYAAIADSLGMWVFCIPAATLSAFVFHWSPVVTFFLLKSDQIFKSIPHCIKVNRFRWVKKLTK